MNATGRFGKNRRLSGKKAFARVFGLRCSAANRFLVVYAAANGLPFSRLGLVVGRRHGPAVRRNRLKRWLREAFRRQQDVLPVGYDLVCVPRPDADPTFQDYCRSIRTVADRAVRRAARTPADSPPPAGDG